MDEQELCKKRLLDLSRQANRKDIVVFSDFLNLNEQNIFHSIRKSLDSGAELFGGYDQAERQMVAFIPDALCYEWTFPITCMKATPRYPKYAEELSHRDVLGALMHLGIDRGKIGDIICQDHSSYIFCDDAIHSFIMDNLTQVRHTMMQLVVVAEVHKLAVQPKLKEQMEMIASNRIDAIIAKAYHLSRSQAAEYLASEKVFMNGRCITNCNQSCDNGAIISVRGKGRFIFETDNTHSKKGKLRVRFLLYQ